MPGPNFIELLKQKILLNNFLLSRNEQDTSHKLFMLHSIFAGNPVLISIIWLCLTNFLCFKSISMKFGPGLKPTLREGIPTQQN